MRNPRHMPALRFRLKFQPQLVREVFLNLALMLAGVGVVAAGLMWVMWSEADRLSETTLDVGLPSWKNTPPVRAVLIADIHADNLHMNEGHIRDIARRIDQAKPDIIFLAGDYIGGDWGRGQFDRRPSARGTTYNDREIRELTDLGDLHAPLGVYAVLGNHDCGWSCSLVTTTLAKAHINVLQNTSARIEWQGGHFYVVGLGDFETGLSDADKAFAAVPNEAAEVTLLHEPDPFVLRPDPRNRFQLSGHTHGGQVRLPLLGRLFQNSLTTDETLKGWMLDADRTLIVTRGLGETGAPFRFGSPPQIMVLKIHFSPTLIVKRLDERTLN